METQTHLMELMLPEILARLPMRSIWRFKTVSKSWKSTIESACFRRLFLSLHPNSTSTWSCWFGPKQAIEFHGCDLPNSPASVIQPSLHLGDSKYKAYYGDLVLITDFSGKAYCYVGNPEWQTWFKIPPPPCDSTVFGLLTCLDDYDPLDFKVLSLAPIQTTSSLNVFMYSSKTGVWTSKVITQFPHHQIINMFHISVFSTVFFGCVSVPGVIVAHDFCSESDKVRVVQLPDYPDYNKNMRGILTTSQCSVLYVKPLTQREETVLKIWCLNEVDGSWRLLWQINLSFMIASYTPMLMDPFSLHFLYLWSQHDHHWVSCCMLTGDYTILRDESNDGHQDCFIDHSVCGKTVVQLWNPKPSSADLDLDFRVPAWFFPFASRRRWNLPQP